MECDCGQSFYKWAKQIKCCKDCFIKEKVDESSRSEDEPQPQKPTKQSTKRYKKKDNLQTNVNAVYILDNNDDYEGHQVGDNHVNRYVENSDNEDDDDNVPRAKSARLRTITSKSKRC